MGQFIVKNQAYLIWVSYRGRTVSIPVGHGVVGLISSPSEGSELVEHVRFVEFILTSAAKGQVCFRCLFCEIILDIFELKRFAFALSDYDSCKI